MEPKNTYNKNELLSMANGDMFGKENAKLPLEPMLMIDRILNIEKGEKTGSFEFIDVSVKNKEVRFYSNNKNYGHYTYDHLISHQISGDFIEINYKNESGKNLIISIQNHDH